MYLYTHLCPKRNNFYSPWVSPALLIAVGGIKCPTAIVTPLVQAYNCTHPPILINTIAPSSCGSSSTAMHSFPQQAWHPKCPNSNRGKLEYVTNSSAWHYARYLYTLALSLSLSRNSLSMRSSIRFLICRKSGLNMRVSCGTTSMINCKAPRKP
jgi:hypothetical protein